MNTYQIRKKNNRKNVPFNTLCCIFIELRVRVSFLNKIMPAHVRSRLEFGSVIWNPKAEIYKDDIESIQNVRDVRESSKRHIATRHY